MNDSEPTQEDTELRDQSAMAALQGLLASGSYGHAPLKMISLRPRHDARA